MSKITSIPRVKTETAKILSPISRCGDNWWREVRVRSPHRGVDRAFRSLPSLGEPAQLEECDPTFPEEINGDRKRISNFVLKHADRLNDRQRENIGEMLDRADRYINDAVTIQDAWSKGFSTPSVNVPPWSLNGELPASVTGAIREGHLRDCAKWKKLIRSALRNLRCSEEVAKKATIRSRNIEHENGRRFSGNGFTPIADDDQPPQKWVPHATLEPRDDESTRVGIREFAGEDEELDDELEEGDISLEEDEGEKEFPIPEPKPISKPKPATSASKKDNTLLIMGTAALGALILARR